jgi:hypothetical protein
MRLGNLGRGASLFSSKAWLLAMVLAGGPGAALAQAQPAQPPADAPQPAAPAKPAPAKPTPANPGAKTVEGVTVTGASAPDVQSSIDKHSYTLGKDLLATTGSIADALRNVPSVEVDLQGNLSVRGDANVTILVDGKPSPAFEGKGRADALQQLPADQIERVEVITNPSAALNPEGTGGVINLITKQSRGAGVTGSAYASAASGGLKRAGLNLGYNTKTLAITGSLAGNYQRNKQHNSDERDVLDPASGHFLRDFTEGLGRNITRGPTARLNITWTATPKDQVTGAASYNEQLVYGHPNDDYRNEGVDGTPILIFSRPGKRRYLETDNSISAGWKHSFGEGHELSVDAVYNDTLERDHTLYTILQSLPPRTVPLELIRDDDSRHHTELRVAYSQRVAGGALNTGYELRREDNDANYSDAMGPTAGALVLQPNLANHYLFEQSVNSLYATYQHAYGGLDAQLGVRVEDVRFSLAQLTSGERDGQHYDKLYPTLHLAYKLDDGHKLTASYSVRVQRPPSVFLDPLVYVNDPLNIQVGNPRLKPKETRSFELGYERHSDQLSYQATFYARDTSHDFAQLLIDLGGGRFESTIANLGASQAIGADFNVNGKLSSKLSYNASLSPYWNRVDAGNLAVGVGARALYGVGGRANLNWQATPDDMLQLNAIEFGRRPIAQGEFQPVFTLNMGWRHKLGDRLTATVTGQDLLATSGFHRRLDTPTLMERFDFKPVARSVLLRLDYRFGGGATKAKPDPSFEYETGAGPPG